MKWTIMLLALVILATADDLYSTENDHLDIEAVVGNPETLKAFSNCFNDKGPCDETSADFKKDLPEAITQACAKCTTAQKHIFKRFLETIKVKETEAYQIFKQKYDPQNKYLAALESAIASA